MLNTAQLMTRSGMIYHVMHDDTTFADQLFEDYQRSAAATPVPLFQRRALKNVGDVIPACSLSSTSWLS